MCLDQIWAGDSSALCPLRFPLRGEGVGGGEGDDEDNVGWGGLEGRGLRENKDVPTGLERQIPYPFFQATAMRGLAHLCSWLCAETLGHRNKLIMPSYLKKLKSLKTRMTGASHPKPS